CATSHPFPLSVYLGTLTGGLGCFPLDNEPYHPLSDSQEKVIGIRSLTEFGNQIRAPSSISALPPILRALEASPKAISERTSYLRVRLAFHPYPHFIPAFFNIRGFVPPVCVTCPSPWTWVDHTVSGLRPHTNFRPFPTRFRFGSITSSFYLAYHRNSPVHSAIGTP